MKKLFVAPIGAVILSVIVSSTTTPAFALGGCGPNFHRNYFGRCVFGGQNEQSCLRRTGHLATRMPNGTLQCL